MFCSIRVLFRNITLPPTAKCNRAGRLVYRLKVDSQMSIETSLSSSLFKLMNVKLLVLSHRAVVMILFNIVADARRPTKKVVVKVASSRGYS